MCQNFRPGRGPLTPAEERRFQEKWAKEPPPNLWIMVKVLFLYFTEVAILLAGIVACFIAAILIWAL